ncbi:hypothetical protein KEM54_004743, partial [Ascosphaera aggregata]
MLSHDATAPLQGSSHGRPIEEPQTPPRAGHGGLWRTPLSLMTGNMKQDIHFPAGSSLTPRLPKEIAQSDGTSPGSSLGPKKSEASRLYELDLADLARRPLRTETPRTTTSAELTVDGVADLAAAAASSVFAAVTSTDKDSTYQINADASRAGESDPVVHTDSFYSFYAPSASDNTSINVNAESQLAGTPASLSSRQCDSLNRGDGDE